MSKRNLGGWQELLVVSSTGKKTVGEGEMGIKYQDRVRVRLLLLFVLSLFALLNSRLLYLQVFSTRQNYLLSENNHIEQQVELAPRGVIRDRNGAVMAEGEGKKRNYPLGSGAAHLVGYLAEVTQEEIGCTSGICYSLGEYVGRAGAERSMESILKGKNGGKIVEVDAKGQAVRELGSNGAESGRDVYLSVDARMQKIIAEAMGEREGAAVALDLSGQVLGLYSSPSFDPAKIADYLGDTDKQYFLDRVIAGAYPPGSVYKLVTAYAGLETGEIDKDTLIEDTGEIRIGEYRYGNWYFDQYGSKEGEIDVERALARSNDIFFYKVGEMVGIDTLVKWSKKFGLGEKSGIELGGEVEGLVPDRLWRERLTGDKWFLGNTYHLAIGQGDLQVTPLQVARMTVGAVSGRICNISILLEAKPDCDDLGLKSENIEIVTQGMAAVCSAGGTAFPFFDFVPPVLCKTGTAEHAGQRRNESLPKDQQIKPHAWITVVYPAEEPELVLTILLDSAGEGSYEAGPVAKQILEKWRDTK